MKNPKELYASFRNAQIIEHAFEEWSDYREQTTAYLLRNTTPQKSLAIFGAGECNDLDLNLLIQHFSEITLFDCNEGSMRTALHRYELTETPGIHRIKKDFVGISDEDYIAYTAILTEAVRKQGKAFRAEQTAPEMLKKLEELYSAAGSIPLELGAEKYDYSIALGVHSQLNNMAEWIWSAVTGALGESDSTVPARIKQENEAMIRKFNTAVIQATKKNIFFGCERSRIGIDGAVEGAVQAFWDIQDRLERKELELVNGFSVCWPFDLSREIIYSMEILNLQKIKKQSGCCCESDCY